MDHEILRLKIEVIKSKAQTSTLVQEMVGAVVMCGGETTSSIGDGDICVGEAALSIIYRYREKDNVGFCSDGIFG